MKCKSIGAFAKQLKHLPVTDWPEADRVAFDAAFAPGDIFDDDCPTGAHLSDGSRRKIICCWRRWLAWLTDHEPEALLLPPADRLTPERLKGFIKDLETQVRVTTVASYVDGLYQAAKLLSPGKDWSWLAGLKRRLHAREEPLDRFDHLVAPSETLDLGLRMMDEAKVAAPRDHKLNEIRYRDGLMIALLSLWPIRRRSMAALTVDRHIERAGNRINLLLFAEDTKGKRAEAIRLHPLLVPYLEHYLDKIRPILLGKHNHSALWVSQRGTPLQAQAIYNAVRKHVLEAFGKRMGLHDFRRSAGTHLALEAPEMIGILPGVLSHADPKTADRHYNIANSETASRRFGSMLRKLRHSAPIVRKRRIPETDPTEEEA